MSLKATAENIDRLLPQTQCERCGYEGCRPYAEAIAANTADINRCPPGGEEIIAALAELLDVPAKPLDPECGEHPAPIVALIDEETCIGCTRCIQACPVDAIVGAAKLMHTVIAAECTGCELCLPPCPVDCIDLVSVQRPAPATAEPEPDDTIEALRRRHLAAAERRAADQARQRFNAREARLDAERNARDSRRRARQAAQADANRQSEIEAMVAAVRARRAGRQQP
ncbi:MAG TPA: RnfABCDGE type electron transport complex subunit B [Gammaproteobacteria bacterium]|nr:RnfABCDGE type electron transport complex subunit B [Gammaproteobacteria bacterium]